MFLLQFCVIFLIFRHSALTFQFFKRKMLLKTRFFVWVTVRKPQTLLRQIAANFAADFVSNFFISRPRVFLAEPCPAARIFENFWIFFENFRIFFQNFNIFWMKILSVKVNCCQIPITWRPRCLTTKTTV